MTEALTQLAQRWSARWPEALALWSRFTKLSEPRWCFDRKDEARELLTSSFAMIRLNDQAVVISLAQVKESGLEEFPLEVMGHEIGHHVYCPADLADQARLIARIRRALPTKEKHAGLICNLYADLLINDRLQHQAGLRMGEVYRHLGAGSQDRMWTFYMRIYEILWSLPRATLATGTIDAALDVDAGLGARVLRVYARDWMKGSSRFAALCFPYLEENDGDGLKKALRGWLDTASSPGNEIPDGLTEMNEDELDGAIHPALDPRVTGLEGDASTGKSMAGDTVPRRRYRDPAEYREILKSVGVTIPDDELTIRYYRERAVPHLVRFPVREIPQSTEPQLEGLDGWAFSEPLDQLDVFESLMVSETMIPGVTTVQRVYGTTAGSLPALEPVDLYIGVDCSGSMQNPALQLSFPVLAGTIIAISALRAGARVMVTLSGEPGSFLSTEGFSRDEHAVLRVLTGYLGTGYAFGIHRLGAAFDGRTKKDRPAHVLIVTDHDMFHMLTERKLGVDGWTAAQKALDAARGGGTYVLHMPPAWSTEDCKRMKEQGWDVVFVTEWEDIVAFAREFSMKKYTSS
ncbi:MAG: VWA domain-containing protein [Thermoanaerobaculia bacterium]